MVKFVIPGVLIGAAIALFWFVARPFYAEISALRATVASYDEALGNSKALEAERDKLTAKYNTFDPADIIKLEKLMPDSVDNIRMILEMEKIALPYGMTLQDVRYDNSAGNNSSGNSSGVIGEGSVQQRTSRVPYGTWDIDFSTESTYDNFLSFLKDLERNLRILDISSINFSSSASGDIEGLDPNLPLSYKYQLKIKTYWLRN